MKVKIIQSCYVDGEARKVGDVVDTDKAYLLIGSNQAVAYTETKKQEVSEVEPEQTQVKRGKKK